MWKQVLALGVTLAAVAISGCGDREAADPAPDLVLPAEPVSMDPEDYPVFPDEDAGADPAVPADQGGRGFTGEGWETNTDFALTGDPRATKGGTVRDYMLDFPGTLRIVGPESNTVFNSQVQGMVYEALLDLHPTTLEFIPALATHWQISEDGLTYRFRINPNARWADGEPVTATDVVATWRFKMDEGLQSPMGQMVWSKFEEPVAESKYIVRVTSSQVNWRNFLYFSAGLPLFPAHVLDQVDGARYLEDYNFKLMPGTGPYTIHEADVRRGRSVTISRRDDYWAEDHRRNVGRNNFAAIRFVVVRDPNLAFEMFKRGDLDYYFVTRAQMWVEELDFDRVQRGLIQKRKIYNNNPSGLQGLAFNTRRAPFNDIRVRQALTYLFNRERMIESLFHGEYLPQNSYFAGSVYENPDNPLNQYDPERALALLAEAGWDSRDASGRLVRAGRPLNIELLYGQQQSETYLTVFQEDLRRVGIGLTLRLVTPETLFRLVMERNFDLVSMGWTGLLFPNPETSFHSSLADQENTNNITGMKNPRIDEICHEYDGMFDIDDRVAAIREIDGILANEYHYILHWYAPYQRIAFWNRFGYPEGYISRVGDYRDLATMWWIQPDRDARLRAARRDASLDMPVGKTENRYWLQYDAIESDDVAGRSDRR